MSDRKQQYDLPVYLFREGSNSHSYLTFGSHFTVCDGVNGAEFAVWAGTAVAVSVTGDFCGWGDGVPMVNIGGGIFRCFIPNLLPFCTYKYIIYTSSGERLLKSDPFAYHYETAPSNGSKLYDLQPYRWSKDALDYESRRTGGLDRPVNIYELHTGSWRRFSDGAAFDYRTLADDLCEYLSDMGYTHVELLPITEHPYDGSWGYQCTGYFAPTSRFGTPEDFMYLIDRLHANGIGVILDWVPAHFPKDAFGLAKFDGGYMYESSDPLNGEHKEWGTLVFDYRRGEVRSFLISSAVFWFEQYHIDGLRLDAVASMLYLDYNRPAGEWTPNLDGGRENIDAVEFLRQLNTVIFDKYPYAMMIAEESTTWPLVTSPVSNGGLGFNYKWNMGWMNDTLDYLSLDPFFRKDNHNKLTFSMLYAFSENFILPLSHDEVVHGKRSLIGRTVGEYGDRFKTLKTYFTYMYTHPGKKLMFMGGEFAQFIEWDYKKELDWLLLDYPAHRDFRDFTKRLNRFYLENAPLWEIENSWDGFEWAVADDNTQNIYAFTRTDRRGNSLLAVFNFSPVERKNYRIGVDGAGKVKLVFSTDGDGKNQTVLTEKISSHGKRSSVVLDIAPLGAKIYRLPRKE